MMGATTIGGRGRAATAEGCVRPGAQEAASRPGGGGATRGVGPGRTYPGMLLQICVYVNASAEVEPAGNWRYNSAASASMKAFLGVVELVLALLVMLGVLLQTPKASGLGGTIGGGGDSGGGYRTKRGLEKNLFYSTIGLVVLSVVVSVVYIRVG